MWVVDWPAGGPPEGAGMPRRGPSRQVFLERPTSAGLDRRARLVSCCRDPKTTPSLSYDGQRHGTLGRTASDSEDVGGSGVDNPRSRK